MQPPTRSPMFLLLLVIAGPSPARAADGPAPAPESILLNRCRVEFARASSLGSSLPGVLKECLVRPGDRVTAGQVIGRLRDDDVRAELDFRKVTGENPVNVRLAETRKTLADSKLLRAKGIKRRGYYSDADLQAADCEAQLAQLDLDSARQQYELAQIQVRQAEVMLRFREFVAPHGGIVSEIFKTPGESVSPNFPVFRVVDDGRMQVIGQLDVVDAWRVAVGQPVAAWPTVGGADLPIEAERFEGTVVLVESQIDPATHTCKVVAEVANRPHRLLAGLEARLEIRPPAEPVDPVKVPAGPGPDRATIRGRQAEGRPSMAAAAVAPTRAP